MTRTALASLLLATLAGCATTAAIAPMDGDTYLATDRSAQVGFGPADASRATVYKQANEFCGARGQQVETVKIETTDSGFARAASAALQFRCKPKA